MRIKLITLLLFVTTITFAQVTISGTIKDISTGEPVELATIAAEGTNIVTVSNSEGTFRITVPQNVTKITISHLSYIPYTIEKDKFSGNEVYLEPTGIALEEVVISNIPPEEMLKNAINATKKRLEKSLLLNTYYREFVSVNNTYTKFADGLLDFYVKRKSGKADVYVKQSRAVKLADAQTNNPELSGAVDALNLFDVGESIEDSYNFKYLNRFLKKTDAYNFEAKTRTDSNGKTVTLINMIPRPEIEEALFEGTVVYDPETSLILDLDFKTAGSHKKYIKQVNIKLFGLSYRINNEEKKTTFKLDGDKYIVTYNRHVFDVYIKFRDKIDDTFAFVSDNLVMDYKEGEFDFDRNTRFKEKSLFKAGTYYNEPFWKTANAIPLTSAEEAIIKNLEEVK